MEQQPPEESDLSMPAQLEDNGFDGDEDEFDPSMPAQLEGIGPSSIGRPTPAFYPTEPNPVTAYPLPYYLPTPPKRPPYNPLPLGMIGGLLVLTVITGLLVLPTINRYINPTSFVSHNGVGVVLIQWAEDGKEMRGTFQATAIDDSGNLDSGSIGFTGTHDGNRIVITSPGFLIWGLSLSGTLSWRSLTLDFPQKTGGLKTVAFSPGDESDYNDAVNSLRLTTSSTAGLQPLSGATLGGTQDGFTRAFGAPTDRSGIPWYTITLPGGTASMCYCTEHTGSDGRPHLASFHIDAPSGVTWNDQQGVAIASAFFPPDAQHVRDFTDQRGRLIHLYVSAELAATFTPGEFKDSSSGQLFEPGIFSITCGQPGPSQCSIMTGD